MKAILKNLLEPSLTRTGTLLAGMLTGYGVSDPHANAIATGAVAAVLVALDFAGAYIQRKFIEHRVLTK